MKISACKNQQLLVTVLLATLIMVSCGSGRDNLDITTADSDQSETLVDQVDSRIPGSAQPGIHESSGFFPVEPGEVPLRFIILGDMGGPVLYSSSTVPAWLSGKNAFILGPDGRLSAIDLAESSSLYLPPDLAAYARYYLSWNPWSEESQSIQEDSGLNLPVSVSVTGPTSAVFMQEDNRLFGVTDGALTFLRNFEDEIAGTVTVSGSPMEIVIADSYGKILALDAQTANTMWENTGGPVLLSGGMAIYVGLDSYLQVHDALDGQVLARSDLAGFSTSIKPTRDATRIFAVLGDGKLVAMDNAGTTEWIAETGIKPLSIMNDLSQAHVVSRGELVAFDKDTGAEQWRLALPVAPAGDPVVLPGSFIYAGTDGKVYASVPDSELPVPLAADPGERVTAVIRFRLEKYVRNRTDQLVTFMPYVDEAAHEGPSAFTVFAYGPVELGGEYWLTWDGEDRDVVLALFNERGDELRANLDEFGAHDSFSYRLDEKGQYFIALGRQDPLPSNEPLFLSVIPARRN